MRVFFHILRRADGTGGQPVSAVARSMNALTAGYAPNQIYFQNLGYDEVRSDYYYGLTSSTADTAKYRALVTNIQRNYSALNLYLLDDTSPYNSGRANGIPGFAVAIGGKWQDSSWLARPFWPTKWVIAWACSTRLRIGQLPKIQTAPATSWSTEQIAPRPATTCATPQQKAPLTTSRRTLRANSR